MDKEYIEMLQRYEELEGSGHLDSNDIDIMYGLLNQNSFENCLDRKNAEKLIKYLQDIDLDQFGGWALWDEVSFKIDG